MYRIKKYVLAISILLLGTTAAFSQQADSTKVLMSEISKSYKGDAKDGLAHGKGTAKGEDTYTGEFKNGLPDGKGKYTYKNGNTFTGVFSNGLKNGAGTFNYSVNGTAFKQKGYWENGDYVGTTSPDAFYNVTNLIGIESYTFRKIQGDLDTITLAITSAGNKYIPSNFNIKLSSGQSQGQGKNLIINNYTLPLNCEIHFITINGGMTKDCYFTFEIQKPGNYEVLVNAS